MHVDDQTYQRNGKTYRRALLRNSYRKNGKVHHDTIANLSMCSAEEIEAIKFALKNKKNLTALKIPQEKIQTHQGLSVGAVWLLYQLAKRLGIEKALGRLKEAKLALWMVISAVIGSVSRLSATRLAQSHAACDILRLDGFCEDDLYGALDWLNENQNRIEDRLFKDRYKTKTPNLFLYDVTSSYFEGQKNELAAYGHNRDGKKGKKQIVIGLLTDDEGYPVSCEVFQGNTKDTQTFKSQVDKVAKRFGIEKVTFVGDRGMIKSAQISELSAEDYFITALTKPQIEKLLKEGIFQMQLFDKDICEVIEEGLRYVLRRNPIRAKEIQENRQSKLTAVKKLCAQKTQYLAEHPRAKVHVAKRKIKQFMAKVKIDKWSKVRVKGRSFKVEINDIELQEVEKLDGCYALKTNLSAPDASKETIHDRYKSLAEVEWAFRTMKTSLLHIRSIYVRKANRTRAHVFSIMLAYMIAFELRRLWHDIELTIEEGIEQLSSLCATEVVIGSLSVQTIPKPRENGQMLLEKAGVTLPDAIPSRKATVFTRKKLVEERRS
ncbi:MAG: IS1634 family transposase [Gammaproteobacteria bacterium]|nr:IS1634 family transposase [Gammaproteobacteria bacterium]